MAGAAALMMDGVGASALLTAVVVVLFGVALTGGLHIDGFADTADAFFSYRDQAKRLTILEDSRIGAFGTIAIVSLLLLKVTLLYEWLEQVEAGWWALVLVPFLSRMAMNLYFTTTAPAKKSGIAAFIKERLTEKALFGFTVLLLGITLSSLGWQGHAWIQSLCIAVIIAFVVWQYRKWSLKHFGGVTGDLAGALIEGMEVLLWMLFFVLR